MTRLSPVLTCALTDRVEAPCPSFFARVTATHRPPPRVCAAKVKELGAELHASRGEREQVKWELEIEKERATREWDTVAREHASVRQELEGRLEVSEREREALRHHCMGMVDELGGQCGALQQRMVRLREQHSESRGALGALEGQVERLGREAVEMLRVGLDGVGLQCRDMVVELQQELQRVEEGREEGASRLEQVPVCR